MKKVMLLLLVFVLIITGGAVAHTVKVRVEGLDLQTDIDAGTAITVRSKLPNINGWSTTGITLTEEQQHSTTVDFTMPENSVILETTVQKSLITYNANGGVGAPINQTKSLGVPVVLSTLEPTMEGHTFIEWNTAINGTGTRYMPGDTYSLDVDVTLYAQWSGAVTFTWDTTDQLSKSIQVITTAATTINWGDGTLENVVASPHDYVTLTHTYALEGNYTVRIKDDVVTHLSSAGKKISYIDLSNDLSLKYLNCQTNNLSNLDLSNNTALTKLLCTLNNLTSLDLSNNTELTYLLARNNSLTSVDVSNSPGITYLNVRDNNLTSIDVSNITALTEFHCFDNNISSLDISNNTALAVLGCNDNNLSSLDVSNNLLLTELDCTQPSLNILVMDSRQTVNPTRHANTKKVTITQTANGTITYDKNYRFNITPNTGSQVITLVAGGISQTPSQIYDFVSLAEDTTLTATFGRLYTVTFDANGGVGAPQPQSKIHGVDLTLTAAQPTRANKTFVGWNTSADGSGANYAAG